MPSLSVQLRVGQRIAIFDEAGNAELIDIDHERNENGDLVVTDHVFIRNRYGDDDIYDDVAAHFRGEPVDALPIAASGALDANFTPALMEQVAGSPVKAVS